VCYCDGVSLPQDFLSFDGGGMMRQASWLGVWTGFDFSVSGDGRWIAYLGAPCTTCHSSLTIADTKTHSISRLPTGNAPISTPIVSPSGTAVAYYDPTAHQLQVRSTKTGALTKSIDIDSGEVRLMAWLDQRRFVAMARTTLPGTAEDTMSILVVTPGEPAVTETGAQTLAIDNIYHGPDVTFLGWIR
jgi:hypothetical protein